MTPWSAWTNCCIIAAMFGCAGGVPPGGNGMAAAVATVRLFAACRVAC